MMTSHGAPRRLFAGPTSDATVVADILRSETVGGILMLAAAAAAVIWASLDPAGYGDIQHTALGPLTVAHWASDGLLAIFFFLAGLELKREFTTGSLSRPVDALVPMAAAVAGMAVPAAIYLVINLWAPGGLPSGWAIPMATDIAFALAVLAVTAPGLPASLRAFLLTLAVVDDLGAILVIAIVFTTSIHLGWLAGAVAAAVVWWWLQRRRIDAGWVYLALFAVCWWCTYASGIHATVAGVLLGLLTRSGRASPEQGDSPIDRWEHRWRPLSAGVVVPIFALLAAGVALRGDLLVGIVTDPMPIGIMTALLVGKTVGVFGGAYLVARFSRAQLAPGLRWREVLAVGVLTGVGFTVALLVSELTFAQNPESAEQAKTAVLAGSVLAAVIAGALLHRRSAERTPN